MWISFGFLFLLIILSGFFSASETAFSSVNLIRLKNANDEGRRGAKKALYTAENFDKTISAVLIGNNLVNMSAASLATIIAIDLLDQSGPVIGTIILTIIVLIFGEVIPKSYAKENSLTFCLNFAWLLLFLIRLFYPFIYIIMKIKSGFSHIFEKDKNSTLPSVTEDEFGAIIDTMEEEGVIEQEERDMIHSVLELSDTNVYDIMTPRVDMIGVYNDDDIEFIKDCFIKEKYSRMPVYKESKDNVIGILYERDFFEALITLKDYSEVKIEQLMKKPIFVPKSMHVDDLMEMLQRDKQHMAIISDEYGGTSGVVTMEDCLEELVGEIYDEHDEEEYELKQIDDANYDLNANISLDDLFDELELGKSPDTQYSSVGGWLYEKLEEIPIIGDQYIYTSLIKIENDVNTIEDDKYYELILTFTVKELYNRRMKSIHLNIERTELGTNKEKDKNNDKDKNGD